MSETEEAEAIHAAGSAESSAQASEKETNDKIDPASIVRLLWNNFLALEKRLVDSFYYVSYTEDKTKTTNEECCVSCEKPLSPLNLNVHSLAYRAIILEACSDIECALKIILGLNLGNHSNLKILGEKFIKRYQKFSGIIIEIPASKETLTLWEKIENTVPGFWNAYNAIKHQGDIKAATLKNARDSLAGLFAMLLIYFAAKNVADFFKDEAFRIPQFFYYKNLGANTRITEDSYNIDIPGISDDSE